MIISTSAFLHIHFGLWPYLPWETISHWQWRRTLSQEDFWSALPECLPLCCYCQSPLRVCFGTASLWPLSPPRTIRRALRAAAVRLLSSASESWGITRPWDVVLYVLECLQAESRLGPFCAPPRCHYPLCRWLRHLV